MFSNANESARDMIYRISYRFEVKEADLTQVAKLLSMTGFFYEEEVEIAVELLKERLGKGDASGYHFIMAEYYGRLIAYTCYGPIPCTKHSYDLYWIAVDPDYQGKGLGKTLLKKTEHAIRQAGGEHIYIDTSQRLQYTSTRTFYEHCGYKQQALLPNFYAQGDGKVIYCKYLPKNSTGRP